MGSRRAAPAAVGGTTTYKKTVIKEKREMAAYNDSAQKTPAVRKNARGSITKYSDKTNLSEEINQLLEEMDKMEQRGGRGSRGR